MGVLASGCTQGPDGTVALQPLVFPFEGQLGPGNAYGTTFAIVLDSNYIDGADDLELHNLNRNRITILMTDPNEIFPNTLVPVRSVFSLQATPNSNRHRTKPGSTATVVVADMPAASSIGNPTVFPFTVKLRVLIDGQADFEPRFVVTGKTGIRNAVIDPSFILAGQANLALEPRPTLRLRPKRRAGIFQPGQPSYGGLEFTLNYRTACINAIDVYPATEASNATVVLGPIQPSTPGYALVKAVLVDPKGFNLNFLTDVPPAETTDETLAGEGPLIDVAVAFNTTTDATCRVSNPSMIEVGNLVVSGVDGAQIFSAPGTLQLDTDAAPATNAVFRTYPVDLPPPAPSSGC